MSRGEQRLAKLRRIKELQEQIAEYPAPPVESAASYPAPGTLAAYIDKRTVETPALALIDEKLRAVREGRINRLIISMPPQEGKSQRVSRSFVLWSLMQNPDARIAIVSYEKGMARRWGRAIRNDIATHPELDLRVAGDSSAAHEWSLAGSRGGLFCTGIGGPLTGRHVDMLVIDDPIKDRKQADSLIYREAVWDWWQSVGITRLAPGAPVVLILTRWHHDDLAGRLLAEEDSDWDLLNIPAKADHKPEEGETDPLGREPGQWMQSARARTVEQWTKTEQKVGIMVFASLYQGHPSPGQGTIFDKEWWQYYETDQWVVRKDGSYWAIGFDELIQSWDMTFKDTEGTDFVCGQVWGRRGVEAYLLDQVLDRMSFVTACQELEALSAKWPQAVAKLIEDKANGPAVISSLRKKIPGLIPIEPDGSKSARAAAVSPFAQAAQIWLPHVSMAPWVGGLVKEASEFPRGQHDDQVDTLSQALTRLLLIPLLIEDQTWTDPEDDDFEISRY